MDREHSESASGLHASKEPCAGESRELTRCQATYGPAEFGRCASQMGGPAQTEIRGKPRDDDEERRNH